MIRFVPTNRLEPGDIVARPIFGANGAVLLRPGAALSAFEIRRLAALGFPGVYVRDPDSPVTDVPDVISDATRAAAINRLWHTFRDLEQGNRIHCAPLFDSIDEMLSDILSEPDVVVNLGDLRTHDGYTFGHSVNVAAMSLLIGHDLGLSIKELRTLGLGALLHDIGKIAIPPETLRQRGPLTSEQWQMIRQHPRMGFDILRRYYEFSLAIAHIAYQHHERLDGSGYPRGLTGDSIHRYARIVAVVDIYDAMRSERVYRPAVPVHEVLEEIRKGAGEKFAPEVVNRLLRRVAPYPVGTTVLLTTGEVGVVIEVPAEQRDRPVVRVLLNPSGRPVKGQLLRQLAKEEDVGIERVGPGLGEDHLEHGAEKSRSAG